MILFKHISKFCKFSFILIIYLFYFQNLYSQNILPEDPLQENNVNQNANSVSPINSMQPPMKNIFMNVLWGSLIGGVVLMGLSTLDDQKSEEERFSNSQLFKKFVTGATYGGLMGVGVGVYLSYSDLKFKETFSQNSFPSFQKKPPLLVVSLVQFSF